MKKKLALIMAVLVLICFSFTGCTKDTKDGKTVTIAIASDGAMDQLDAATYFGPHPIYMMIYDGLVYDAGSEIQPLLAEKWDISKDGKTYTFHLKKNVKFSDGTDFTADTVLFNMNRWVNMEDHSSLTASMVEDMKVIDDYTFEITYKTASNAVLKELSYPRPVRMISPSAVNEIEGDPIGDFIEPIGTGQWMLESYTKDEEFILVPNPNYWGEKPKVDRLVFKVITDPDARALALESGEVDIAGGTLIGKLNNESYKAFRENSDFQTYEVESIMSYFLAFNQETPFFKDINVRKALNMLIDKNALCEDLLGGLASPSSSVFPKNSQYVNEENSKGYDYDPEKAKELLQQAGYKDTDNDGILEKDGQKFSITLMLSADKFTEWKTIAEFTQAEFKKAGIDVQLNIVDQNSYDDLRDKRDFDICVRRTSSDSWMPHGVIQDLFGVDNPMMYAWLDNDLMNLVKETLVTQGDGAIQAKYDEIFKTVYENAYAVPLCVPITTFATSDRVTHFEANPNAYIAVDWTSLDVK